MKKALVVLSGLALVGIIVVITLSRPGLSNKDSNKDRYIDRDGYEVLVPPVIVEDHLRELVEKAPHVADLYESFKDPSDQWDKAIFNAQQGLWQMANQAVIDHNVTVALTLYYVMKMHATFRDSTVRLELRHSGERMVLTWIPPSMADSSIVFRLYPELPAPRYAPEQSPENIMKRLRARHLVH